MNHGASINAKKTVISLEMELREKLGLAPRAPHVSRVNACLDFLNSLPSILPVLAPVFKLLLLEFENAIFSNSVTLKDATEKNESDIDTVSGLDRLPWFVIVSRLGDMRQAEVARSRDIMADLQYKLRVRERDISLLQKRIIAFKQDLQSSQDELKSLKEKLNRQDMVVKSKDVEKDELKHFYQTKIEEMFREKDSLEMNLAQANNTIEKLSVFKVTTEISNGELIDPSKLYLHEKKSLVVPEPAQITLIAIREAEVLMHQFYDITNSYLDELEASFLQLRKRKEILGAFSEEDNKEIHLITSSFKASMQRLLNEQTILTHHIDSLRQSLEKHQASKDFVEWKKYALETQRKYSVALYYSTSNGKDYTPYPQTFYCSKCAEAVLICPHQQQPSIAHHLTIPILPSTTHIQFRRPLLRIQIPPKVMLNDQTVISDEDHSEYADKKINAASVYFKIIWHFFFRKASGKRPILPRVFTMDKLLHFISDFYDARWSYELVSCNNTDSFIEYFLMFIKERYLLKDIVLRIAFEILCSLEFYQEANTTIHLFVRQLAGLDTCIWKYLRLVNLLLQKTTTMDVVAYRSFIKMLYPSRGDMLYEQLELEHFGSLSKTRITVDAVREHIKVMLRKQIEPNVRAFTGLLTKNDPTKTGYISETQFKDSLMELLPQAPQDLATQQYKIAQHGCLPSRVGIDRLGQVMAYLFVHLCSVICHPGVSSENAFTSSETPQLKYLIEELEPFSTLEPEHEKHPTNLNRLNEKSASPNPDTLKKEP